MAKKALYWTISLTALIILINIGMKLLGRSTTISEGVVGSQDELIRQEQEHNIVKYDGYRIDGSIAVSQVKTVITDYDVPVTIQKGSVTVIVDSSSQFKLLRDIDSDYYLHPFKEYEYSVRRDVNDAIEGIDLVEMP